MSDLVSNFHVIFFSIKNKPSNKIIFVFHTFCYYTRLSKSYVTKMSAIDLQGLLDR